jgi:hypothetical protein
MPTVAPDFFPLAWHFRIPERYHQAVRSEWPVTLDNVSAVPGWLSDTLCKAVTGDGYVDRVLYSDDDVTVLAFRRVILMTSIDPGALVGDLAERLLVIELNPIPDCARRPDAEVRATYADSRPAILASLLDLLVLVLAELPAVPMDRLPRMADFALILKAVDTVQQWTTLDDYLSTSTDVATDVLDGDVFANAVIPLVNRTGEWQGTATELLAAVFTPDPRPKEWPKDATRAAGRLKRLAAALRTVGIEVTDTRSADRSRMRLYKIKHSGSLPGKPRNPASATSAAPGATPDQPERTDASADAAFRASITSIRSRLPPHDTDAGADADRTLAPAPGTGSDPPVPGFPDVADVAGRRNSRFRHARLSPRTNGAGRHTRRPEDRPRMTAVPLPNSPTFPSAEPSRTSSPPPRRSRTNLRLSNPEGEAVISGADSLIACLVRVLRARALRDHGTHADDRAANAEVPKLPFFLGHTSKPAKCLVGDARAFTGRGRLRDSDTSVSEHAEFESPIDTGSPAPESECSVNVLTSLVRRHTRNRA